MEEYSNFDNYRKKIFFFNFTNFKAYQKIVEELDKTGLKLGCENNQSFILKYKGLAIINVALPIVILYKSKYFGLINKTIFSIIITSILSYGTNKLKNKELVENLINSDSQIGHESRILVKYFIPDHSQINIINYKLDEFRELVKEGNLKKKDNINNYEEIIKEEEKKDAEFKKKLQSKLL